MIRRYAVLEDDRVVNVIVADEAEVGRLGLTVVASDEAGPGWSRRLDGVLVPPPEPPRQAVPDVRTTRLAEIRASVEVMPPGPVRTAFEALMELLGG